MAKGKNALLIALGMPKGKAARGGSEEPDGDESEEEMGSTAKRDAARDLIDAVKAGDVTGVEEALSAHYRACQASEYGDDDGDEEG